MELSPKALAPLGIALIAAIAIALLTGDKSYLLLILLGLAQTGGAILAAPASGVTQREVEALADIKIDTDPEASRVRRTLRQHVERRERNRHR